MTHKIIYGNSVISYDIIKTKRTKTSQITVTPYGITVRMPQTKSDIHAQRIIQEKIQWIFKKQLHYIAIKKPKFSNRSSLMVLEKKYKIRIIPNSVEKTRIIGNTIEFHISQKRHTTKQIKKQYDTYLQKRANTLFPKLVKELSKKVGVNPIKINIKQLKSRWGSATTTGEVNLNYNLMKTPKDVIKYVILHELCHFKIKEHSHFFWSLMTKYMSEYEKSKDWLDSNGIKIS